MTAVLDHLVYAVPDLAAAVVDFERRTGVRPVAGGSHAGRGTANYLVGLGSAYLELIGPDPDQPDHAGPRPFGVDATGAARLATWAARTRDIESAVAAARSKGFDPGPVLAMSRTESTGEMLEWRLTMADEPAYGGLVPFLIDWGVTAHPAGRGLPPVELASFTATHPEPGGVRRALAALGVDLAIEAGPETALHAELRTPRGIVGL
jgi:hypothetical protein